MVGKGDIRRQALCQRDGLAATEIEAKSRIIVERLVGLDEIRRAATVMVYLSFASEVRIDRLLLRGWAAGKRIVVPHCRPDGRELTACRIDAFDELEPGHYGIRAPKADRLRPVPQAEIDAVIVPAAAFDRRGYRIGYGGGYYDRFLPQVPQAAKIGVAFACQIVPEIPAAPHDVPVDRIVTEKETIVPICRKTVPDGERVRPPICP
ncbi:MAG: 5-formyltetrahydrofolate cyclo-ligase [Deltaproteobacteria bacterium]|nr:5-formyltetrahydrofolate cyclo-ligase [Deltaproteobacteria bacterium]